MCLHLQHDDHCRQQDDERCNCACQLRFSATSVADDNTLAGFLDPKERELSELSFAKNARFEKMQALGSMFYGMHGAPVGPNALHEMVDNSKTGSCMTHAQEKKKATHQAMTTTTTTIISIAITTTIIIIITTTTIIIFRSIATTAFIITIVIAIIIIIIASPQTARSRSSP